MIGLSRLKRAIADVPTGGMQTGYSKVPLKLCDAQRLEVEFNAIIAERDAALAQNAELVAMVEALRSLFPLKNPLACEGFLNYPLSKYNEVVDAFNSTPTQHLRDRDAEVVEMAIKSCAIVKCFGAPCISVRGLTQYAEKVRSGNQ